MDLLEGLNSEQRAAASHVEGPLLVVAGAGTGKTQVITRRIAYLIAEGYARPDQILALTFTEKAAREMAERLYDLVGWQSFQVPVMTFHSFGTELLGRFASHIGRSVRGGLLNDTQKSLLLLQHIERVKLSYYGSQNDLYEFVEGVVDYIGQLQNAGVRPDDYRRYVEEITSNPGELHPQDVAEQADLAALYELYEMVKTEAGVIDYNDQLNLPLQILQQRPNIAERLAREYKFVLVDEYQDTNAIQDELLRAIVKPGGNIFAVGDDDQAIYGFRGARLENILDFASHFGVQQPAVLVQNYRSGQAVLDSSYELINHNNPDRLEARLGLNKRLVAQHDDSIVEYRPYSSANDEQEAVIASVEERLARGEAAADMAILAATHAPLKALAKALRARKVPYALSTAVNIFEQTELIGLWYLLELIGQRGKEEAFGHVLMGPYLGWTAEQYRRLNDAAKEQLITPEEALRQDEDEIACQTVKKLDQWRQWATELSVGQLAFRLVFQTGLAEQWRQAAVDQPRLIRVFEDLQRLLEQMQDFETVALDPSLQGYLGTFPKPPALEVTEPMGDSAGVQLLTVHASKGLEFETVFVINCTQRSWSSNRGGGGREIPAALRAVSDLPPEHELRRLMYVAATRAKRELFVSAATQTAGGSRQAASPFVTELCGEVTPVVTKATTDNDLDKLMSKIQRSYPLKNEYEHDRLPFETTDGWLELGVNDLGSYDFCPYDFFLQKVLGIAQPLGPQLAFGVSLHGAFQAYYQAKLRGETATLAELTARLDELWNDHGYERRDLAEQAHEQAHHTLKRFVVREEAAGRQVLGCELPIRLEVPEAKLRLRGRIDAFFDTPDGVELRDFKTGRKTDAEKLARDAKDNFQLRSYALAYEVMSGQPPASVTLDYVVTGIEGSAELSPTILKNHRAKLVKLAEAIRARDFAPKPSTVHQCAAIKYYGTEEEE